MSSYGRFMFGRRNVLRPLWTTSPGQAGRSSHTQLCATFNQKPPKGHLQGVNDFKSLLSSINLTRSLKKSTNPTGLFGMSRLKTFEGFYELQDQVVSKIDELTAEANSYDIHSQNKKRNLVHIFDDISNELCRVADLSEFVRTSHPSDNYRQAANMVN